MEREFATTLGENVARLRCDLRLTQKHLADACRVTRSTISQIECGHGNPELSTLLAIASALECSVDKLLQSHPREHRLPPPSYDRINEYANSKNINILTEKISKISFITVDEFKRHELKYLNVPLSQIKIDEAVQLVNGIFSSMIVDTAYIFARTPTRHFTHWCNEIAECSEKLLSAAGYVVPTYEYPHTSNGEFINRSTPQMLQIFERLEAEYLSFTDNERGRHLHKMVKVLEIEKLVKRPRYFVYEIISRVYMLRTISAQLEIFLNSIPLSSPLFARCKKCFF